MHNRRSDHRDLEEALLRFFNTLLDCRLDFFGFAVSDADHAFAVTDDDQGRELESTSTLHDLGYTVDRNDALVVLLAFLTATASATVALSATAATRTAA